MPRCRAARRARGEIGAEGLSPSAPANGVCPVCSCCGPGTRSSTETRPPGSRGVTVARSIPICRASRRTLGDAAAGIGGSGESPPLPEAGAAAAAGATAGACRGRTGAAGTKTGGGGAAAGATGDAAESHVGVSPAAQSLPIVRPTRTVCPSAGASGARCKTPPSTASISCVAFSPSSIKSGSPGFTVSPGCLIQPANTPSSIDQPSRGIVTSAAIASHAPRVFLEQ